MSLACCAASVRCILGMCKSGCRCMLIKVWTALVLIDCGYHALSISIYWFLRKAFFLFGCFFKHKREGFQQCVGRLGDSSRQPKAQNVPEKDIQTGYKHPWLESLSDNCQAGMINQVDVRRPDRLRWIHFRFQWTEVNLKVSNSNGIILAERRHHSTTTAANGCSARGLKQCSAGGGLQWLFRTKGKLSFH